MLASFLACLCLAVVGVVGQLTDADFAKFGVFIDTRLAVVLDKRDERLSMQLDNFKEKLSMELDKRDERLSMELDKRDERLHVKLDALEIKIDALEIKIDALEIKIDAINTTLSSKIDVIDTKIDDIKFDLSKNHFFNRIRIEVLQNVSENFVHCLSSDGSLMYHGTRHAVVYEGRVATLFTPHSNCLNSHEFSPTNHGNFILHPLFDLAIDTDCLPTPSALDLTSVFVPSLGDEIIAFGFGVTANVWQGLVAGFTRNRICSSPATHWNSTLTRVCNGEIIAQGHQHAGMSGAPVLNGCGYVGMAHAVNSKLNAITAIFAYVIPASVIIDFIKEHHSRLPTLKNCNQSAVAPPLAAFANCATKTPLTPLQIIINAIP
jgi:hypothetical protein